MRTTSIILHSAWLLVLGIAAAGAHAFLDHAEPRVGSTVRAAPSQVSLSFTQNLEQRFSTVTVTDASGQRVDTGRPVISGSTIRVAVRGIRAGTYRVSWRVLSVDTHTTEGAFTFRME